MPSISRAHSVRTVITAGLASLLASSAVHAAAYVGTAYEGFAGYTTGTQLTTASNLGTGFNATGDAAIANTTAWGQSGLTTGSATREITPGSLTYTGLLTGGEKVTLNPAVPTNGVAGNTTAVGHNLAQTVDSGDLYFSFLTQNLTTSARTLGVTFYNGTTATSDLFSVGQTGVTGSATNSSGNIALSTSTSVGGGAAQLVSPVTPIAYGQNITHLIVGKVSFNAAGNETISIWVDPTDLSTEGTAYLSTSAYNIPGITGFRIFAGGTSGAFPVVRGDFDEIRFGKSWSEVVVPAVTELDPSASILTSWSSNGTAFTLSIASYSGHTYTLQYTEDLTGAWIDVETRPGATGQELVFTHDAGAFSRRFYRISIQ